MIGFENHSQFRYVVLALLVALFAARPARADFKAFAHVYPYFTQPEGGKEVEIWTSLETGDLNNFASTTLIEQRAEIEYGLTNHWDVSFYAIFQQAPQEDYRLDAFSLETRYRFAERGQWPVDTEVYLEFEQPTDFTLPSEIEGKLILQKGYKWFFTQLNLISEFKLTNGVQYGYFLGADGGLGVQFTPAFRMGVEYLLDFQKLDRVTPGYGSFYLGPSIALASPSFWVVATPDFKVAGTSPESDRGDAMRFRVILGIPLD
jgi:hypothetical protein